MIINLTRIKAETALKISKDIRDAGISSVLQENVENDEYLGFNLFINLDKLNIHQAFMAGRIVESIISENISSDEEQMIELEESMMIMTIDELLNL